MTYKEAIDVLKHEHDYAQLLSYINVAIDIAIKSIEKQIPKKPLQSDREIRYCEVFNCPNCGFEFSGRIIKYCYRCGQALDWSGIECH